MLFNNIRRNIGKEQARIFLFYKVYIYHKVFDLINWEIIEKAIKSLMNFSSLFCGTGKVMKTMGAWYYTL